MPPDSKPLFGDSNAAQQRFLSLFLRYEREIFRYVAALVPNIADAEDILQQTAMSLWEKFERVPGVSACVDIRPPFRIGSAELGNWNARSGPNPAPALIRNLSGSFDEFELFSRALTDAEVRELYVMGKPN